MSNITTTSVWLASRFAANLEDIDSNGNSYPFTFQERKQKIELTTNCVIVRNAFDYVSDNAEKLKLESESKEPDYGEEEELEEGQEKDTGEFKEEKTTNDVF